METPQSELLSRPHAQERLRRLAAQFSQTASTPTRHVYFSGVAKRWIVLVPEASQVRLTYHRSCPCG